MDHFFNLYPFGQVGLIPITFRVSLPFTQVIVIRVCNGAGLTVEVANGAGEGITAGVGSLFSPGTTVN